MKDWKITVMGDWGRDESLLAEADARNSFVTLYYSCDKAWPRFLDKVSQSYPFREDKEAVLQNFASDLLGELISIG